MTFVTETDVINLIIEHLKGLFPKTCPKCQRRYGSLKEFYSHTTPVGHPVSYDLESRNADPNHPLGSVAVSDCPCGTPLALTSEGIPRIRYWLLVAWVKAESLRRGIEVEELLQQLRVKVRKQVILEADAA